MSSEQSINTKTINIPTIDTLSKTSKRVDINSLLSRVREKEKLQKKENLVFLSVIVCVIGIVVALVSL
jgi:hypothetical protein